MALLKMTREQALRLGLHWTVCVGVLCITLAFDHDLRTTLAENAMAGVGFVILVAVTISSFAAAVLISPGHVTQDSMARMARQRGILHSSATASTASPSPASAGLPDHARLTVSRTSMSSATSAGTDDDEIDDLGDLEVFLSTGDKQNERFCRVCLVNQPLRCKHCVYCRKCVQKFDHHCPYIGQCVGQNNHRWYLLCVMMHAVASVWFGYRLAYYCMAPASDALGWWSSNALVVLALVICIGGAVFGSVLTAMHIYVCVTNQTTWEAMARHRITYLEPFPSSINPFDEGVFVNTVSFCCHGCLSPLNRLLGSQASSKNVGTSERQGQTERQASAAGSVKQRLTAQHRTQAAQLQEKLLRVCACTDALPDMWASTYARARRRLHQRMWSADSEPASDGIADSLV